MAGVWSAEAQGCPTGSPLSTWHRAGWGRARVHRSTGSDTSSETIPLQLGPEAQHLCSRLKLLACVEGWVKQQESGPSTQWQGRKPLMCPVPSA